MKPLRKSYFLILSIVWSLISLATVVFSYTQIDLNLTLSQFKPYLDLQDKLIYLGYYNRQLNGLFLEVIVISMTASYLLVIFLSYKKTISLSQLYKLIIVISSILFFSYNAFSRDIFNYIFDARILTKYHLNPYLYKALDFPQDDWIRFMHWVHRAFPYGPAWLAITAIFSLLGLEKFILTLFLFKLLFVSSYILTVLYLVKIFKLTQDNQLLVSIFAFNPLVITEVLVSPHIDIVMISLALVSIYLFLTGALQMSRVKVIKADLLLAISIAIKFASVLFAPLFIVDMYKKLGLHRWLVSIFILSCLTVVWQSLSRGTQNWYYLFPYTIFPLISSRFNFKLILLLATLSILPLVSYIRFVLTGSW